MGRVGKTFVFKLTESRQRVDGRREERKGSVAAGAIDKPDTTLELADADFLAMTSGKADAMKLYMGGKLKISGDVMASQKLDFLKKIDPKQAARGGGEEAGRRASTATATSTRDPDRDLDRDRDGDLQGARRAAGEESGAREGGRRPPAVRREEPRQELGGRHDRAPAPCAKGTDAKATTVLRIGDADLAALCKDPSQVRDLFQRGKLRVDGDVRPAHKLSFLKDL